MTVHMSEVQSDLEDNYKTTMAQSRDMSTGNQDFEVCYHHI